MECKQRDLQRRPRALLEEHYCPGPSMFVSCRVRAFFSYWLFVHHCATRYPQLTHTYLSLPVTLLLSQRTCRAMCLYAVVRGPFGAVREQSARPAPHPCRGYRLADLAPPPPRPPPPCPPPRQAQDPRRICRRSGRLVLSRGSFLCTVRPSRSPPPRSRAGAR